MNIQRSNLTAKNISFCGHKRTLNKSGYDIHKFYYMYDPKKYKDCRLELYNLETDDKGNFSVAGDGKPEYSLEMKNGECDIDFFDYDKIESANGFAYRFKLTDNNGKESYAYDNGTVIGIFNKDNISDKYNVILNDRAIINKNGPMQLIMPDMYYPGVVKGEDGETPTLDAALRGKYLTRVRNHANKLGGNFYGIIKRLPQLQKEGVKRIVGMPFTKDIISSHKYWTENAFQISPDFGSEEDYKIFQRELFKAGVNWVADAALVNEGFGGIHFAELLRKGQNSYSKNMFRVDEKIALGILPNETEFTRMKIINAPFLLNSNNNALTDNPNYNSKKPTTIQFYDDRLASKEQKESDSPIRMTTYDNANTDNVYDITKHDHAVYPFPIEVDPFELKRNLSRMIKDKGSIDLGNINDIKAATKFSNFSVTNKSDAGGIEVWDGNVDIGKLNFYRCAKDDTRFSKLPEEYRQEAIDDFERGTLAVKDYAIGSCNYWTKLTANTQLEYASSLFFGAQESADDYLSAIKILVEKGKLPPETLNCVDKEIIENVLNGNYNLPTLYKYDMRDNINPDGYGNDYSVSDYILKKSMDMPLEKLPFDTNLLGIITSPFIAKKANTAGELGVSRYDITKAGNPNLPKKYSKLYSQVDDIYKQSIVPIINTALSNLPYDIYDENGNVSEYGRYVISEVAPELTMYIITKAIAPDANVKITNDGHFDFSKVNREEITMQSLGIPYNGKSSEEEAQIVVNKLKTGINKLKEQGLGNLTNAITARFQYRTPMDFKIAEMIHDRTESGLGWRIDAAKDIAAIDAVRSDSDDIGDIWDNVTDFWGLCNKRGILPANAHAYTTIELTDLDTLFKPDRKIKYNDKYTDNGDAERKIVQRAALTSVANYNYTFSLTPQLYSLNYPDGIDNPGSWMAREGKNFKLLAKLDEGWDGNPGFLFQSPEDGVKNSYTFVGNHDKPRILHTLALNMNLFHCDFSDNGYKKIAADVLQKDQSSICFDKVSSMAVAKGHRFKQAIEDVINNKKDLNKEQQKEVKEQFAKAIADLSSGKFLGSNFDAAAFGTRDFKVTMQTILQQVEYNSTINNNTPSEQQAIAYIKSNKDSITSSVLENVLVPAYDRYKSMYKMLITFPGSPTDFAGDKVGNTGYETKAKNYHQQNRNIVNWEWIGEGLSNGKVPEGYEFIKENYDDLVKIANLRNNKNLSALNDGDTVTLPIYDGFELDKEGKKHHKSNEKVQAVLRYNEDSMVITLYDNSGANTPETQKLKREATEVKKIYLCSKATNAKQGLKHGLPEGTVFKRIDGAKDEEYIVKKEGDEYIIESKDGKPLKFKPEDFNAVILYKEQK